MGMLLAIDIYIDILYANISVSPYATDSESPSSHIMTLANPIISYI